MGGVLSFRAQIGARTWQCVHNTSGTPALKKKPRLKTPAASVLRNASSAARDSAVALRRIQRHKTRGRGKR